MPLRPRPPLHPRPGRVPRARLDPIDDPRHARSLLDAVVAVPLRHETIVVVLDDHRCGLAVVTVSDTVEPDHVLHVVETLACPDLADGDAAALIVASVRPHPPGDEPASESTDADRWFEMCDLADAGGFELVEWFVYRASRSPRRAAGRAAPPPERATSLGHGLPATVRVTCPRDQTGAPPRWTGGVARPA